MSVNQAIVFETKWPTGEKAVLEKVRTQTQALELEVLAASIWREHYTPIIGSDQVEYMLEKFQRATIVWQDIQERHYEYGLLRLNDQPAGYYGVRQDPAVPDGQEPAVLFLSKFYLADFARGHGLGRLMLDYIRKTAHQNGCQSIWLTVNKYNEKSIAVYRHLGFVYEKELVSDIGNGYSMDDYVFRLPLLSAADPV